MTLLVLHSFTGSTAGFFYFILRSAMLDLKRLHDQNMRLLESADGHPTQQNQQNRLSELHSVICGRKPS